MGDTVYVEKCIFCKIAKGEDSNTRIIFQDEEFAVFKDIKPAAEHHYLVITKCHIKDPKQLNGSHIDMVEKLVYTGEQVLKDQGGNLEDCRFGFHWPPFTSINHLHLHIISPTTGMGFIARGIFRPNSYWFVSADWLIDRLKKMEEGRK